MTTTTSLETIVAGLTPAQLNFRPTPDAWTIPMILEHMLIVEDYTLGPIQAQLAEAEATQPEAPAAELDPFIEATFRDRTYKVSSPPFIHPTGQVTLEESLKRIQANQPKLAAMLQSPRDKRIHARPIEAASGGKYTTMDGHQWALAAFAHNERHTNQILEWLELAK